MVIKNKNVLLSIIIPCYNVSEYIYDCFFSIIGNIKIEEQKIIEIIIINDGSKDSTLDKIRSFNWEGTLFNIFIIDKENGGQSSARNKGLEISKGKYILFQDADDIWLPGMSGIVELLRNIDDDIIELNAVRFTCANEVNYDKEIFSYLPSTGRVNDNFFSSYRERVFLMSVWMPWGRIFKNSLIDDTRFPVAKTYEDIVFTSELYTKAKSIFVYNEVCIGYRINPTSTVSVPSMRDVESLQWILDVSRDKYSKSDEVIFYFLYVNVYLCYIWMLSRVGLLEKIRSDKVTLEIRKDPSFIRLPIIKKLKVKYGYIFYLFRRMVKGE